MNEEHKHLAVDPGASGGFAYWNHALNKLCVFPMPATQPDIVAELKVIREHHLIDTIVIEKLPRFVPMGGGKGIPGSKAGVMFENYGVIRGAAMALGYRIESPTPQEWQGALALGTSKGANKTAWKNKLKSRAQELFPGMKITLKTADALLIWEYRARQYRGMPY